MKKFLTIVVLLVAGYFVYVKFIAPPERKAAEEVEQKVFEDRYDQTKAAKQAEAELLARTLMNKQEEYYAINGRYASNLRDLKFTPRLGGNYRAKVVRADENDFLIEISGNIDNDATEDVWEVTKDGYRHIIDDIAQ